MFKANNPFFTSSILSQSTRASAFTVSGTVNKAFILMMALILSASYVWISFFNSISTVGGITPSLSLWATVSGVAAFILAMITSFKPNVAKITAPLYAICEGVVIGSLSSYFELVYPGIVIQSVLLTFGTLIGMLIAYKTGLVVVTEKFRLGVIAATFGIAIFFVFSWIFSMFGFTLVSPKGPLSIGISLFIVGIAALNLVLDFDFIEQMEEYKVPSYMEWYGAFALLVTLVWLYIAFLQLLAKLKSEE